MSSASFMVTAEEMSSLLTSNNCGVAVLTMLVYDWLLCLDQEIALIWNRKTRRTVALLVYVLARYMRIVENGFAVATIFPMSHLSCEAVSWVGLISTMLSLFTPALFSAMRTYALSRANAYLAVIVFILSIVPLATAMVNIFKFLSIQVLPPPFNCSEIDQAPQRLEYNFTMIDRSCAILADLLVIVVTWVYTYKSYKIQRSVMTGSSLVSVLLYSGTIYFIILASLNVLDMILTAVQINEAFLDTSTYVATFLEPISYILICRFLLNLRQVDHNIVDPSLSSTEDGNMSIEFAMQRLATLPEFVGSFGEPVHMGSATDPNLDFEEESPEVGLDGNSPDLAQNVSSEFDGEIAEVGRHV